MVEQLIEIPSNLHKFEGGTPPKINIEPENDGLEEYFPFQTGDFQVPC